MAIVKMNSAEIREKYPLTPDVLKYINEVCLKFEDKEVDDEPTDEMLAKATRPGKPDAGREALTVYVEPSLIAAFRKTGRDWKSRLNVGVEMWLRQTACI